MSYLKSFGIDIERKNPFPFNIPAVQLAKHISIESSVNIFIGDNGSGKSTLLETLAMKLDLPLIGGHIGAHHGFEAARILKDHTFLDWKNATKRGFFFRAEDFSDFLNSVERSQERVRRDLGELIGKVPDSVVKQMEDSMNYSLQQMRLNYGENMQAYSHGEAYLKILETRIDGKGIYLLDEPEASLSPLKQISLIALILDVLKQKKSQFIIATHSPILMGIPGATLYEITEEGIQSIEYKESDHYRITKTFLDNPEVYLRHLR